MLRGGDGDRLDAVAIAALGTIKVWHKHTRREEDAGFPRGSHEMLGN